MKRLQRNYYKNPLHYGELPNIEDFKLVYLELNLIANKAAVALNVNKDKILYCAKKFNLQKTAEQVQESRRLFWKNSSSEYKQQRCNKIKQGFDNWTQEQRQQFKDNIKLYHNKITLQQKCERVDKFKQTWNNRSEQQNKERNQKISVKKQQMTEQQKAQRIAKFKNSFALTWNQKTQEQKQQYIEKMLSTKKLKGNLNTSKQEDIAFCTLQQIFNNVQRQYSSCLYPFCCDFYIPHNDLYIELNYCWTHGGHFFDKNNEQDILKLQSWQQKAQSSKFYENAITTWTIRDVNKLECAKKNNLNYLCFFSPLEFNDWILSLN